MKSKRSKACDITQKVKQKVFDRDNGRCTICGKYGSPNAHYISRSHGGLGIEQNIVTLCGDCHFRMDNTPERKELLAVVKAYLDEQYPNFSDEERLFKKGGR